MNMLGLGSCATPSGLLAMKEMQKTNKHPDTATRSIKQLIEYGILKQQGSGRSTHYILTCGE